MAVSLIDLFLEFKSPHTKRAYKTVINQFQEFLGDKPLSDAKIFDILAYLGSLQGKAQATVRHRYHLLKAFYEFMVQAEQCPKSPVMGARAAISKRRVTQVRPTKLIEPERILKLLNLPDRRNKSGVRDAVILYIMCGAGLRRSEVRGMNLDDVKLTAKGQPYIQLNKTKAGKPQQRTMPVWVWDSVCDLVAQRKADGAKLEDPLFVNYSGYGGVIDRISDSTLARIVKHYLAEIGVDASCHSLRASFASAMLEQGYDSWDVARSLGHSSTKMVDTYDKRLHNPDNSPVKKFKYEP